MISDECGMMDAIDEVDGMMGAGMVQVASDVEVQPLRRRITDWKQNYIQLSSSLTLRTHHSSFIIHHCALVFLLAILLAVGSAIAGERGPVSPSKEDKCPVCGMFVAKYPDFVAEILFRDGSYAVFDGVKDMMKYFLNLGKYNPNKKLADIDSIYVTDYYELKPIDGLKAHYVYGSNMYGPMGKELIPFEKEDDAKEFTVDHSGKSSLQFKEITVELIKTLD